MKSHVVIALLPVLFAIDAVAADLPAGNCAAPQASTWPTPMYGTPVSTRR